MYYHAAPARGATSCRKCSLIGTRRYWTRQGRATFKTGALNHSATLPLPRYQALTGIFSVNVLATLRPLDPMWNPSVLFFAYSLPFSRNLPNRIKKFSSALVMECLADHRASATA